MFYYLLSLILSVHWAVFEKSDPAHWMERGYTHGKKGHSLGLRVRRKI
jgi:hypothetical protein